MSRRVGQRPSYCVTDCSSFLMSEEPVMDQTIPATPRCEPWNKGKLVGQKAPLKLKDIWAIRVRLQLYDWTRELGLFNLGIDSKLRACDLVALRVRDVSHGGVGPSDHHAAEDSTTGAIRDHGDDARCRRRVDQPCSAEIGGFLISEPRSCISSPVHATIRTDSGLVGARGRPGSSGLRHAQHEAHEGLAHLSADEESTGSSTSAWSLQTRKHSPLLRY